MRLAIMQPYFFPYVGYFSLLAAADRFIVFDPVQYIRHGWINRNRILKPNSGEAQYINVPLVKHSREIKIRDVRIANQPWKRRILRQMEHYRRRAPNFSMVESLVQKCFALETDRIVELNVHCLEQVCRVLGVEFDYLRFDELESKIGPIKSASDWALEISKVMNASSYINPIGGLKIFDPAKFFDAGIELEFIQNNLSEYPQGLASFLPGLSILDVLMFNGCEQADRLVRDFTILSASELTTAQRSLTPNIRSIYRSSSSTVQVSK